MAKTGAAKIIEFHVNNDSKTQIKVLERKLENSKKIAEVSNRLAGEAKQNEAKATHAYRALHSDLSKTAERLDALEGQLHIKRLENSIEVLERDMRSKEKRRNEIKYDNHLKISTKRGLEKVTTELQESQKLLDGQQRLITSLLERKNLVDELRKAATLGDLNSVKKYLGLNVSVNSADMTGLCAFKYACGQGHLHIAQEMMPYADIHNKEGNWSPLHISVDHQQWKIAELLIRHGANVNEKNETGQSPLHIACSGGSIFGLNTLLENGADIDQQDRSGNSCLHYCATSVVSDASSCQAEMASLLLEKGADYKLKNVVGRSPLLVAKAQRMQSVAKVIQNKHNMETVEERNGPFGV